MVGGGGKDAQAQRSRPARANVLHKAKTPPANHDHRKSSVYQSTDVCACDRGSSSTEKLSLAHHPLMDPRNVRSQNNVSQVLVLSFQEEHRYNCCKECWDWNDIHKVSTRDLY